MHLKSGAHAGKTTEELLLKQPDWAQWMVGKYPDSPITKSFRALAKKFDARQFLEKCVRCGKAATRATAYRKTGTGLMFWCDGCDPYGSGAERGTLTVIKTFGDALRHVDMTCNGVRSEKRTIIKELARGKGLPKRVGETQAAEFFNS
jgi:hypothetical protein